MSGGLFTAGSEISHPLLEVETMSATNILCDSRSRLASFLADSRRSLVATIVGSSVVPRPGSIAANAFANAFLDRLTQEIESADPQPLDAWAVAGALAHNAFEHARIVVIACATVATAYVARYGHADDVAEFLTVRSAELDACFRVVPHVADVRSLDAAGVADRDEAVASLLSAIEARDPATCEHSRAVGMWCGRLAKQMGMPASQQALATLAGTLHDVGKIATPTEVLLKAGALDDAEWETMRAHARVGAKMLERIPSLRDVAPIVRAHHERIDGRGYPDRLEGAAIPFVARIVSVADSFHAMISKRPYRQAISVAKALEELRRGADSQFDATAANAMLAIVQPAGMPRLAKSLANGTV